MKKFLKLSIFLICGIFVSMSLVSCGDDEPIISSDITKAELTAPMLLFEQPVGEISLITTRGFSFWTFTDQKAAFGTLSYVNNRAVLKCSELYDNWAINEGGKLVLGSVTHNVKRVNVLGVKAYTIDLTAFIPSNMSIQDFNLEQAFHELDLNKSKLWNGLEQAKQNGQIYVDEI